MATCSVCGKPYWHTEGDNGICKYCSVTKGVQTDKSDIKKEPIVKPNFEKNEIVKKYTGKEIQAREAFRKDKNKMLEKGYHVVSEVYVPGQYSALSYIVAVLLLLAFVGILILFYMIIVKPDGTLVVTYEYREEIKVLEETQKANNSPMSVADEIKKLKVLLDEGILSDEEFSEQKNKLLNMGV